MKSERRENKGLFEAWLLHKIKGHENVSNQHYAQEKEENLHNGKFLESSAKCKLTDFGEIITYPSRKLWYPPPPLLTAAEGTFKTDESNVTQCSENR